jgi:orotidine-5'-phosphate decarboxylase
LSKEEHLAVALDTSDWQTFQGWCEFFGPRVGVLKVGLEAYTRLGPRSVETARKHGRRVFLDGKLHDIPNTVAGAVASFRDQGVDLLTLHASGGPEMIRAASEAAGPDLQLLGVTLLTHLDEGALAALDLPGAAEERVLRWARLAADNGCAGAVCSPREVGLLRSELEPPFLLVTPGIRPSGASADDQRRTATPASALAAGADLLVIGRPLTRAEDPSRALSEILAELTASDG